MYNRLVVDGEGGFLIFKVILLGGTKDVTEVKAVIPNSLCALKKESNGLSVGNEFCNFFIPSILEGNNELKIRKEGSFADCTVNQSMLEMAMNDQENPFDVDKWNEDVNENMEDVVSKILQLISA